MTALPEAEPDGSERRVAPRVRTLKRAKILFNNRYSTFDCIVRNISSTGALLTIDEAAHLPKVFDISIGDEKMERPARLVYRRGMLAGIRFLDVVSEDEEQAAHFPLTPAAATSTLSPDMPSESLGHVQRIVAEILPRAITRNFPWSAARS
ncbi:PilZ domain-containing protein [Aureimonas glaciei]|jgi:hypothetical protein|uniref:PilZ domain-containing protein n=1 Tax=Aureimonas glaciei TaxID=1776957 RepID=A0A916XY30_9HYPH|nr:PilZ domain-containing protein [Aureimonas glaciei]GGD20118.1 hypothetical protein GCM10011335_23790 [Aureimonas glaciei]